MKCSSCLELSVEDARKRSIEAHGEIITFDSNAPKKVKIPANIGRDKSHAVPNPFHPEIGCENCGDKIEGKIVNPPTDKNCDYCKKHFDSYIELSEHMYKYHPKEILN